jgi:hypothetical protein
MTKIVLCEADGYLWATALPDDSDACENGPILGPPEGLDKRVHNLFATAGIYTAIDLLNTPRRSWLKLLDDAGVERTYARTVLHIYQSEFF